MSENLVHLAELERGGLITDLGMQLPPMISYDRAEALAANLGRATDSMQFVVGDFIVQVEALFPEHWTQAVEALGLDEADRIRMARVAARVPLERRKRQLSWSHHRLVAHLDAEAQEHWLNMAVNENLSTAVLRDRLREQRDKEKGAALGALPTPPRSYVLERVGDAAETVARTARKVDEGWLVSFEAMRDLAGALGVEIEGV